MNFRPRAHRVQKRACLSSPKMTAALSRIRAERSIIERVRKVGEKRRVRPVLCLASTRPLPLVRLAGEVGR